MNSSLLKASLHRRLSSDDEKGLSEPLNDQARSSFGLLLRYSPTTAPSDGSGYVVELYHSLWLALSCLPAH